MSIDLDRAFKLLHPRKRIPVLQADASGVISPLLDARTLAPFCVSTKKLRRALAGRQRQVLCTSRADGHENAFFARVHEFVALDPEQGQYVIISPLVLVLDTTHGAPLMTQGPEFVPATIPSETLLPQFAGEASGTLHNP
jgi:hypothetical protein